MAVPTNTMQTFTSIGNREDVSDFISNLTPSDTPLQTLVGKETVRATYTEWQTDTLAATNLNNAVVEGDDASIIAIAPTVRVGNYVQTMDKSISISTIQDKIDKYGRKKELAYQMDKKMRELKNDAEGILLSNQVPAAGNSTTARKLRPLPGWYATNDLRGATGADGTPTTAAVDGTQRNFTETQVKTAMQLSYSSGADPKYIMMGPVNRVNFSSQITGGATKFYSVEDKKMVATISVYETDFGPLKVIPNRKQRERDAHIIDPEYLSIGWLEPWTMQELATTGLSKKRQMWGSLTLINKNEAAHSIIADLNVAIL